jgi:hypothetical protein
MVGHHGVCITYGRSVISTLDAMNWSSGAMVQLSTHQECKSYG